MSSVSDNSSAACRRRGRFVDDVDSKKPVARLACRGQDPVEARRTADAFCESGERRRELA
jgi:hypothetical protein